MMINNEPIIEIDIKASYLTILYAQNGLEIDLKDDPYNVEGLERSIVKQWIIMTIGNDKLHRAWPKRVKDKFFSDNAKHLQDVYPIGKVRDAILKKHPLLKHWGDSSLSVFDLMYLESEAIFQTMLILKRDLGIPSLSVHDSLIVRQTDGNRAKDILSLQFRKYCGVIPEFG